ncbi:hypothetical protein BV898_16287 [Hypsibius exemplaris]|uniref:DNA2/NAM7 helicase helicase domain-containing protein n=1 Tax=Hypsibius exemplaris TaxID=2072580 RepID=A0A9X6NEJ6_HYPEX|nr:hypothetical protein BV898_16287 [Hypsibius exemplaris]
MPCLRELTFPYVIINECIQGMEPDVLVEIRKGCKKLVLIGDQEQVGSVIIHPQLQGSSLAKSLFECILEQPRIPKMMLQMQY